MEGEVIPQTEEGERFFKAIEESDYETMNDLIRGGYDLNKLYVMNYNTTSPICYAINKGGYKVVIFLIENGANPNLYFDLSVLQYAIIQGKYEIVEILLEKGADPNMKGFGNQNDGAFFSSSNKFNPKYFELLLKYGADPNTKTIQNGESILISLSKLFKNGGRFSAFDMIKLLLKNNCDSSVTDKEGNNFLHYFENHVETRKELEELCHSNIKGSRRK
jgi:ankyrin repeat protein